MMCSGLEGCSAPGIKGCGFTGELGEVFEPEVEALHNNAAEELQLAGLFKTFGAESSRVSTSKPRTDCCARGHNYDRSCEMGMDCLEARSAGSDVKVPREKRTAWPYS